MFLVSLFLLISVTSAHTFPSPSQVYPLRFGNISGLVINDGVIRITDNPFSVPQDAVLRSFKAASRSVDPIIFSLNILLLDTPSGRILVDTGAFNMPAFPNFDGGRLISRLRLNNISPASIDHVLLTHGHADHVGGLVDINGSAAFPNANIILPRTEYEFWSNTTFAPGLLQTFAVAFRRSLAPYQNRTQLVDGNGQPLPGIRFMLTPGHTPGHSLIQITSGTERLLVIGDAWATKPDQVQNPDWALFTETDPESAYESRVKVMDRVSSTHDLVLSYHEQFPGLGRVRKDGAFFDWNAASYVPPL